MGFMRIEFNLNAPRLDTGCIAHFFKLSLLAPCQWGSSLTLTRKNL